MPVPPLSPKRQDTLLGNKDRSNEQYKHIHLGTVVRSSDG